MSVSNWSGKARCVLLAEYMINHQATVRATASVFGVSKSTVHKDVTQTLKFVNKPLFLRTKELLQKNKEERHLRGGEATRIKYSKEREHSASQD